MHKTVATLFRFVGIFLVLLGLAFLSPLADLLPVEFSVNVLDPLRPTPGTSYYRIVPVEHSYWIELMMVAAGTVLFAVGRYLPRRR